MPSVYIDTAGDVRSTNSGRIIAPAGTTAREARIRAALWAAAADALTTSATAGTGIPAFAEPTPISAAPSYATTVTEARQVLAVIDIEQLADETARDLAALAHGGQR